jgi:thiamine-phosphate pyrophosphorylase
MPRVDFPLYLVTDRTQTRDRPLVQVIDQALHAGLRAVQLREKDLDTRSVMRLAEDLLCLTRAGKSVAVARRLLGPDRFVGVSAHSADEVLAAGSEGADFAVLGPIYDTPSKRAYGPPIGVRPLEEASRRTTIPILAIGGITLSRIGEVRRAGAFGVAVVSSILSARDVESSTRHLVEALVGSE